MTSIPISGERSRPSPPSSPDSPNWQRPSTANGRARNEDWKATARLSIVGCMSILRVIALGFMLCAAVHANDQPQWGAAWTRNMVSSERNLPDTFDPKTGKNIRWVAELGTESHSTPVIAKGRVFIGTNNGNLRDPKHVGDRGV